MELDCGTGARDYDVVVLGSGAAGLTAALVAAIEGLRAIVIEKSPWIGGTTVQQNLGGGRLIVHHAQEVAGGALNGTASTQVLTQQMLQPIVTEAIARWQEAGAPPSARPLQQTAARSRTARCRRLVHPAPGRD